MRNTVAAAIALALPFAVLAATPRTAVLDVQNMTCSVCPVTVKKALEKTPGVTQAKIDFDKKTATVTFDPDRATEQALTKATTEAGYPSVARKNQ